MQSTGAHQSTQTVLTKERGGGLVPERMNEPPLSGLHLNAQVENPTDLRTLLPLLHVTPDFWKDFADLGSAARSPGTAMLPRTGAQRTQSSFLPHSALLKNQSFLFSLN